MDCQLDAAVGQLSFGRAPSLHDVLLPHGWLLQQKWRLRVWSDPELHYRQAAGRADNGSEWHYGKRGSFERNGQPQRSKTAASGITGSAAVLNGMANPKGANGQYQFQWSTDPTLATNLQTSCNGLGYD